MGLSAWLQGGGTPGSAVDDGGYPRREQDRGFTSSVYAERSYHMTGVGYFGADQPGPSGRPPMRLEPDVDYVRSPASPLTDIQYQGWQKENALALLQYSSRHPGMGPHVPGTDPPGDFYPEGNPMRFLVSRGDRTNKVPAGVGAVGPGLDWMPNPSNPTASYAQPSTGLWAAIRSRLFGG